MARAKRGFKARRRKKKIFRLAKGFHFDRRNKIRHTMPTVTRALAYGYVSRKLLKRDMRKLWIIRINAAARMLGTTYSLLINALAKNGLALNRKMLADLAVNDFKGFEAIVKTAKINPVHSQLLKTKLV